MTDVMQSQYRAMH